MIHVLEKGKPDSEVTRILKRHAESRIALCERKIKKFEVKYNRFKDLQRKVLTQKDTLQEERDHFNWEASLTELRRLKKLLESKNK